MSRIEDIPPETITRKMLGISVHTDDPLHNRWGIKSLFAGLILPLPVRERTPLSLQLEADGRVSGSGSVEYGIPAVVINRTPTSSLKPVDAVVKVLIPRLAPTAFVDDWLVNHGGESDGRFAGIGDHNPRWVTLPVFNLIIQ